MRCVVIRVRRCWSRLMGAFRVPRSSFTASVDEGDVGFVNLAIGKHFRKPAMRGIVFGNDDQAARLLIESMHDPWPQRTTCAGEGCHVMEQGIHQRASVASAVGRA